MKLALALLGAVALTACSDGSTSPSSAPARPQSALTPTMPSVVPYVVAGDPTCAQINASWKQLRIDPPTPGSHQTIDDIFHAWLAPTDGIYFDWSTFREPAAAVLVPGSSSTNVYAYTSPVTSDDDLHSPLGAGGQPVTPSHISLCYDEDIAILYGLQIRPTAFARFTRTWSWEISKGADQSSLILPIGAQATVNYSVDATATYVDSNLHVYGNIFVTYQTALPDVDLDVTVRSDIDEVVLNCSVGGQCPYWLRVADESGNVSALVRASSGDDTVESPISMTANFSIGEREEIDENIEVTDDQYGVLGGVIAEVRLDFLPFDYSRSVGPYSTCGEFTVTNTASFVSLDAGQIGTASWSILVHVPCVTGCPFGVGYWKTHSRFGPAPYVNTWVLLGEETPFFLSGMAYYEVLWTPPAGGERPLHTGTCLPRGEAEHPSVDT